MDISRGGWIVTKKMHSLSLIKHTSTLPATTVERWFGMKEIKIKFSLVFMLLSFHPHRPKSLASTGLVCFFYLEEGEDVIGGNLPTFITITFWSSNMLFHLIKDEDPKGNRLGDIKSHTWRSHKTKPSLSLTFRSCVGVWERDNTTGITRPREDNDQGDESFRGKYWLQCQNIYIYGPQTMWLSEPNFLHFFFLLIDKGGTVKRKRKNRNIMYTDACIFNNLYIQ